MKTLTIKQNAYIAEFAYGLKKITPYHEDILINYFKKLTLQGFKE